MVRSAKNAPTGRALSTTKPRAMPVMEMPHSPFNVNVRRTSFNLSSTRVFRPQFWKCILPSSISL